MFLSYRWLNVNCEQSLNFNRQKYIHSQKDGGLRKTYYLRIVSGGKVLKCHSWNTENNLGTITVTVFCLFFRHWGKKKISKLCKAWMFYYVTYQCCKMYFCLYLPSSTKNFCSLTWWFLISVHLQNNFFGCTNLYLGGGDKSIRCNITIHWKTWILLYLQIYLLYLHKKNLLKAALKCVYHTGS